MLEVLRHLFSNDHGELTMALSWLSEIWPWLRAWMTQTRWQKLKRHMSNFLVSTLTTALPVVFLLFLFAMHFRMRAWTYEECLVSGKSEGYCRAEYYGCTGR